MNPELGVLAVKNPNFHRCWVGGERQQARETLGLDPAPPRCCPSGDALVDLQDLPRADEGGSGNDQRRKRAAGWQSFRTKKDRSLELTSAASEVPKDKKRVKIAVKVVDIFGNDTMTIVDVAVGKK